MDIEFSQQSGSRSSEWSVSSESTVSYSSKAQSRNFLCTRYGLSIDEVEAYLSCWSQLEWVKFVRGQLEECPSTKRLHAQFFINTHNPTRCSKFKTHDKLVNVSVVKVNNGSHDYCMKENTRVAGPWEYGIRPLNRNNAKDIKTLNSIMLDKERGPKWAVDNNVISIKEYEIYRRNLKLYLEDAFSDKRQPIPKFLSNTWNLLLPVRDRSQVKQRNYWFYSTIANLGKTKWLESLESRYQVFIKKGGKKAFDYWDKYKSEEIIALDEYNGPYLDYATLNCLADTKCELRVYAGVREVNFKIVIVCSNQSIATMYPHMNHLLYARFREICLNGYQYV